MKKECNLYMKYLIAGLGNVGIEYELTRHNIGFLTLDRIADSHPIQFQTNRLANTADLKYKNRQIHFIKPTIYMNLSGKSIVYWLQKLKISNENLLVIVDDLALPFGCLRMRNKGGSAGHNGLKDIESQLSTQVYNRLRMGIGNEFPKGQQADFVLANFTPTEQQQLAPILDRAIEMIFSFCTLGSEKTMSLYND